MRHDIGAGWRRLLVMMMACEAVACPIALSAQTGAALRSPSHTQSIMLQPPAGIRPARDAIERQPASVATTTSDSGHHTARIVTGVLIGAVAGSAIVGGAELHHAAHYDDSFFQGPAAAVAFAAGAVVGGLLGWLVAAASQ